MNKMKQLVNNNQQKLILMLLNLLKSKQSKQNNLKIYSLKTNMSGKQMVVMKKLNLNLMKEEERSNI